MSALCKLTTCGQHIIKIKVYDSVITSFLKVFVYVMCNTKTNKKNKYVTYAYIDYEASEPHRVQGISGVYVIYGSITTLR